MLSSKQRASTLRKNVLEDEKTTKKKVKAAEEEKTSGKSLKTPIKDRTKIIKTNVETPKVKAQRPPEIKISTKVPTKEALGSSTNKNAVKKSNVGKTQTKRPLLSPPSSRITKTQYFSPKTTLLPSKKHTETATPLKPATQTKKSITQKSDIKEFIKKAREDTKKKKVNTEEVQRPGTATLKNPVVLKNIEPSDDADYEDDFDSYESDFESDKSSSSIELGENCASCSDSSSSSSEPVATEQKRVTSAGTDDEKKLDSGTFDLTEQKHKQVLDNIRESVEKEKLTENPASLPDEGFEEVKSLSAENGCFINFTNAQKKLKKYKIDAKQRKRGEEILNMIKLDSYNFTLFDMAPMSYETYIKLYGQQNCLQVSSQTGDDDVDEECQTDDVIKSNKWTQAPITFSKIEISKPNYLNIYKQEFMGVGNDDNTEINYNHNYNNKYLLRGAQMLLNLLQENHNQTLKELQHSDQSEFSTGYIECNTLKNTFVTYTTCNPNDSLQFLTVHKPKDDREKSVLCTWHLSNLNQPEKVFVSYSEIICCCFNCTEVKLIFAGSTDGAISVWNCIRDKESVPDCISDVGSGHFSKIVSIYSSLFHSSDSANQLCTMDCTGNMIFWSIINLGKTITLAQNNKITLNINSIQTTNLLINPLDPNHLFIATSMGYILHKLINKTKIHPKQYSSPATASEVTCMAACPFSELYFLVGFQNGSIALYCRISEKPLMFLVNKKSEDKVEQIEWSRSKPCVFYVKYQGSLIDIWDLTISDMVPTHSIVFKENVEYIKIMEVKENHKNIKKSGMVVGYCSGELQLHILNKEHGQNSIEGFQQDVKKFLNYVNRL